MNICQLFYISWFLQVDREQKKGCIMADSTKRHKREVDT